MSIWNWVQEFRQEAQARGDTERVRLCSLLSDASPFERDPDRSLQILEEGKRLAQALREPRWVLFFTHWKLQVLFYYKGDYRTVLEDAVQAALTVSNPQFADFPQRICLQEDLITAYLKIDPLGYEDQIEKCLEYMQQEVTLDLECRHCVLGCRSEFEFACGRLDAARDEAVRGVMLADQYSDTHQLTNSFLNLCLAAFAAGDFEHLGDWASAGEELARQIDRKAYLAQFLMFQAVVRLRENDPEAPRFYRSAESIVQRLLTHPDEGYYDATCAYHIIEGDREKALQVRERQLTALEGKGQLDQDCRVRMERCRLLAQLGRITEADLEAARVAARKLRKPERYLREIEEIATGGTNSGT